MKTDKIVHRISSHCPEKNIQELPNRVKNLINKGGITQKIANYDELKGYLTLLNPS